MTDRDAKVRLAAARVTAQKFNNLLTGVKERYVQRHSAVDVMALALLSREHVLLIGPPGTAKTALIEDLAQTLGASYFGYLLTRFTEPAELFGAIDVPTFHDGTGYTINTDGMLPKAEIAFLDEIFNGSSAILNTLLTLINERKFHNGPKREDCELITLLGATNEMNDDPVLQAFCDRFLFRCRVNYVTEDSLESVLAFGWTAERRALAKEPPPPGATRFSLDDLVALQRAVGDVDLTEVRPHLAGVLRSLHDERVTFSDRRAVRAQKAIAAHALLSGRAKAQIEDLGVLAHLWSSPGDEAVVHRVVEVHGIPLPEMSVPMRDLNEITYQLNVLVSEHQAAIAAEDLREILRRLGLLVAEVRATHPRAVGTLRDIQQAQTRVLEKLREMDGDVYV